MSIITFTNTDAKETGQTLSASAIATNLSIEHNYKTLLISTDFNDKAMEGCFFDLNKKSLTFGLGMDKSGSNLDVANGLEGLIRTFASNRASGELLKSYTRPILRDRLDLLTAPKTTNYKEYCVNTNYFSQIADVAKNVYDIVIIDLCNKVPDENKVKVLSISDIVVIGLIQSINSIKTFLKLKNENEFYKKNNVVLSVDKYNPDSKYTAKNIARMLGEKTIPITTPYNILFADNCNEGKIVDYILSVQGLEFNDGKDGFFYSEIKNAGEKLDYLRKQIEYGITENK